MMRDRARSEAAAKKPPTPGSVIVHTFEPVHHVPWWRGANEKDRTQVFKNSNAGVQGDTIIVETQTPSGLIRRYFNWRDVESVVSVPPIPYPESESK